MFFQRCIKEFPCINETCLYQSQVCNGIIDCTDKSDECNCNPVLAASGECPDSGYVTCGIIAPTCYGDDFLWCTAPDCWFFCIGDRACEYATFVFQYVSNLYCKGTTPCDSSSLVSVGTVQQIICQGYRACAWMTIELRVGTNVDAINTTTII